MAESEAAGIWRHSRVYALGNLFNRASGFVLLPLYTHVLTPADFGIYAIVTVVTDLLAVVLGMGLGRALVRLFIEAEDEEARAAVVWTALMAFLAMAGLFCLLAPLLAVGTVRLLYGGTDFWWLFTVAFWGMGFTALLQVQLSLVMVRKEAWLFFWVSIAKSLLFIALNIALVVGLDLGVAGIIYGTFLSSAAVALALLMVIARQFRFLVSLDVLRALVRFGAPLVPAVFLDTALASLDRLLLNHGREPEAVGAYALGLRLAVALRLFAAMPFFQIWGVRQLEVLQNGAESERRALDEIFLSFMAALTLAALAMALFAPELVAVIAAPEFAAAAAVVPLLALGQLVTMVQMYFEVRIHHAKKTEHLVFASGITLLVALPVYWLLIDLFGAIGAAAAVVIAQAVRAGTLAWLAARVADAADSTDWSRLGAVLLGAAATALTSILILGAKIAVWVVTAKLGLLIAFAGWLLLRSQLGVALASAFQAGWGRLLDGTPNRARRRGTPRPREG